MANHHTSSNRLWILGLIPLSLAAYLFLQLEGVASGQALQLSIPWVPDLNVNFSIYIDGLSLLMSLLVLGIGGLILIYASGYMAGNAKIGRFFFLLIFFMIAMLGVVVSDNIFLLFIFWELTSISSYLLIGFSHESEKSQKSAQQALIITGLGGLALMAGLIMLGYIGGSWELSELLAQGQFLDGHPAFPAVITLIFLGAFTKSAQFPFHFWLPNAMAAPTPVSAYLHSATMVKAGVYLLARLYPIFGGSDTWFFTLVIIGGITGILGGWLAWQQKDLKRIMAYTTISALGILVFLLGVGQKIGTEAAVLFLFVHSLYKGALFMIAGSVDHETGTRDVTILGGLRGKMPLTMIAVTLATLSMAGIPPLVGFVGKEVIYEATVENVDYGVWLTAAAFVMNFFNVAAAAAILYMPFIRSQPADSQLELDHTHEAPWTMWVGPLSLGILATLAFFFVGSELFSGQLIQGATEAVYGQPAEIKLYALPPALTIVPILSIFTIAGGILFFAVQGRLVNAARAADAAVSRFGPENGYFAGFDGLLAGASSITLFIQNGKLRRYVLYVVVSFILFVGLPLFLNFGALTWRLSPPPLLYELIVSAVIILAALMVTFARSRLAAVAALGVVGYGIAILFLYFNAPDLAMTQFSIETFTVILFVLVLYRLPAFKAITSPAGRLRDLVIAVLAGGFMAMLVLLVTAVPQSQHVIDYYAQNSYTLAKGQNVVNVILVDFRGFDTLVEISVLSVAAIGVYALIRRGVIRGLGRGERRKS